MSNAPFDPYYKWLGIPPHEQPANHYRLLGIPDFTSDLEVIENCVEQRIRHVRSFQLGDHTEEVYGLLNELAGARACLLDANAKREYDLHLMGQSEPLETVPSSKIATVVQSEIVESEPSANATVTTLVPALHAVPALQKTIESPTSKSKRVVSIFLIFVMFIASGIVIVRLLANTFFPKTPINRIVLWNQHNSYWNNCGTDLCNVSLLRDETVVWRMADVRVPWEHNRDTFIELNVPQIIADQIRIDITKIRQYAGGLAEVQVFAGSRNIALGGTVITSPSGYPNTSERGHDINDGITTSSEPHVGYWLIGKGDRSGWAVIDLVHQ